MDPSNSNELVLRPSKWGMLPVALISALFAILCLALIFYGEKPPFEQRFWGVIGFLMTASGAVFITLIVLVPLSKLILTEDGFTHIHIGRHLTYKWASAPEFSIWRHRGGAQIIFDYDGPQLKAYGKLNRLIAGRGYAIPAIYTLHAHKLVVLMNERRAAALAKR